MSDVTIKLFKAEWCGHCKHFKPEWQKLQEKCSSAGINTVALDADANQAEVNAAGVHGFPTIKIYANGTATEYNGPRDADAIFNEAMKLKSSSSVPVLNGGGMGGNFYHQYRKYKAKYLRLRSQA